MDDAMGEKVKFFPKKQRLPKDAVRIPVLEEARKGRGYFAPYSDWEADTSASRPEKTGDWTFAGRRGMAGWTFAYRGGRLSRVAAPSGRAIDFAYDKSGRPVSVSQDQGRITTASPRTATSSPSRSLTRTSDAVDVFNLIKTDTYVDLGVFFIGVVGNVGIGITIPGTWDFPYGRPFDYSHTWSYNSWGDGVIERPE